MELNIPKATTASHEVPIFNDMAKEANLPVSEIKARIRKKMLELHEKAMDDPSILSLGGGHDELVEKAIAELRTELQHPEETTNGIRVILQALHEFGNLVNRAAIRCIPASPLLAIDWPEVALLIGPLVPNGNTVIIQELDAGSYTGKN